MAHAMAHPSRPLLTFRQLIPSTTLAIRPAPTRPILQTSPLQQQSRPASRMVEVARKRQKAKQKKLPAEFQARDLRQVEQFSLCDAMRYIRAFEVGRNPHSSKYEMHVRLRTLRTSPVIRNRMRLPHPVDTSIRICVICPADSKHARAALSAGATLVGEEEVFAAVRDGTIEFDRCICHADSAAKLQLANLGRILGPRGLLPNPKNGTVVKDVGRMVRELFGGSEYRERTGVVRLAIGQLAFSPEMLQENVRAFMQNLEGDVRRIRNDTLKEIKEVVLSSTNGPGFSLNGNFRSSESVPTAALST